MTVPPYVPRRAERGAVRTCRGWAQEAALRMLHNNLDPEVPNAPRTSLSTEGPDSPPGTGIRCRRSRPPSSTWRTTRPCWSAPAGPSGASGPTKGAPGTSYTTNLPFCIALAVREMGLSPDEALWAATAGGAAALRRLDVGHLGVGAIADFLVLDAPSPVHLAYRPGRPWSARCGPPGGGGSEPWMPAPTAPIRKAGSDPGAARVT